MRRAAALAALALALGACDRLSGDFRLSGSVDVAPALRERAPKTNSVLFVVAKNAGGVPVAVHRIVNPEFPAPFRMGPADLLVPGVRRQEALSVHVEMNSHGALGSPRPGDLMGGPVATVRPGDSDVRIRLDKQL